MLQPQEIQVWYILPAIRRELAILLTKKHNISQREAAKILGVSPPAISQYMKSKRAKEVKFKKEISKLIEKASENLIKDHSNLVPEMQNILKAIKEDLSPCRIRKSKTKGLPAQCRACLRG